MTRSAHRGDHRPTRRRSRRPGSRRARRCSRIPVRRPRGLPAGLRASVLRPAPPRLPHVAVGRVLWPGPAPRWPGHRLDPMDEPPGRPPGDRPRHRRPAADVLPESREGRPWPPIVARRTGFPPLLCLVRLVPGGQSTLRYLSQVASTEVIEPPLTAIQTWELRNPPQGDSHGSSEQSTPLNHCRGSWTMYSQSSANGTVRNRFTLSSGYHSGRDSDSQSEPLSPNAANS